MDSLTVTEDALEAGRARRAAVAARRALLENSGLFDGEWYRRHMPSAAGSDLAPLDHYRSRGVAALASPGPLFDARAYLREAWHLTPGVDDPLVHYLEQGLAEGRSSISVVQDTGWNPLARPVEPQRSLAASSQRPLVAVVVHVFYVELFGEICRALAMMPYRFSLLVTTDEAEKAAHVRELFQAASLDAHLLVRVGPNRGRNFGPFLIGFRDAVMRHDLVLHLHTKKSLYAGSELAGWRQSLLRTLLPARSVVSGIIERFIADPKLGVLTACPDEEMRYWGYNWLSNRHLAQPLFDRLGLDIAVPRRMFDYPIGGMFWARTSAIAKLLDHDWVLEDFPDEDGQIDGTVMHAIERSIVLVAADAGYGFGELDYRRGLYRPGWASRNLEQYAAASHDELLENFNHVDTVSFDIFDTLLTRQCLVPDAAHRFIGFQAARRFPGADKYVSRRQAAEHAARADRDLIGDVDLDEIHARFRTMAPPGWSQAAIAFVEEQEVALDLRLLMPRDIMIAALRYARRAGRRIILTSDSYLPRRVLDELLTQYGITELADAVYLSSERRARKDRGDLWVIVAAAEIPVRGRLLHVGDNEQSDIQKTADAGIRHFHVMSPASLFDLHGLGTAPGPDGTRPLGDDILLGPLAAKLFNSPYIDRGSSGSLLLHDPEQAGAVLLGPLMFAFVAWLVRHPAVRHLDRLFFVAREGYFLKRLYDAVRIASGRDDLPPATYFQCSRRTALAAAQGTAIDPDAVLAGAGFRGSLSAFFLARFGFVADEKLGLQHTMISLPRDNDLVRCLMELMREQIVAHGQRAAEAFTAYARATGMIPGTRAGFVDVGYSGTMQSAIQGVLGQPLVGLYMGISETAVQVRRQGGHAFGAFAQGDVGSFTGGYGLMLEAFLTAPHGQVIGYDDSQAPIFRHDGQSQTQFAKLERAYQGAEAYALTLLRTYGPDLLDLPFRPEAATSMLQAVRDGRLRLSPDLMASLAVEDDFCGGGEIAVFDHLAMAAAPSRPA